MWLRKTCCGEVTTVSTLFRDLLFCDNCASGTFLSGIGIIERQKLRLLYLTTVVELLGGLASYLDDDVRVERDSFNSYKLFLTGFFVYLKGNPMVRLPGKWN
jgi:hypothetical protein